MDSQFSIESAGDLIIVRVRGLPTEELLVEVQSRVLQLLQGRSEGRVLYDALEVEAPSVDVPLRQRKLDQQLGSQIKLKRAILVPNPKIAYLARLAFGDGDYRIFYDDVAAATRWLREQTA
jgi:hypothetical protein